MEPMHINEVKSLAHSAHADAEVRESLFRAMASADRREAVGAAWALTHLPASDNRHIAAHRAALIRLAVETLDTSLRRLSLALLERIDWQVDDVDTGLLDFCLMHLADPAEAVGVRALCIKVAYAQCRHFPELCAELRQCLLLLEPSELKPGLKHTRMKTLKRLT